MILIKKAKDMHFVYCEVGEIIASIPLDEFFDYFNCIKKDIPW